MVRVGTEEDTGAFPRTLGTGTPDCSGVFPVSLLGLRASAPCSPGLGGWEVAVMTPIFLIGVWRPKTSPGSQHK